MRIAAWIVELNDDAFRVRSRAQRQLLAIGEPALAPLYLAAVQADSSALAARQIGRNIHRRLMLGEFAELARRLDAQDLQEPLRFWRGKQLWNAAPVRETPRNPATAPLEQGIGLVARLVDPGVDLALMRSRLDDLALRVRNRLGPQILPRQANPAEVVAALQAVLFREAGYGRALGASLPESCSLPVLLETGVGLPITVSHLVVAVGQRLDVPLTGLQIPYQYMCKYDGAQAPAGYPTQDLIINAAGGGELLTPDDVAALVERFGGRFDPDRYLAPSSDRETLIRMLSNLVSRLETLGWSEDARLAEEAKSLLIR